DARRGRPGQELAVLADRRTRAAGTRPGRGCGGPGPPALGAGRRRPQRRRAPRADRPGGRAEHERSHHPAADDVLAAPPPRLLVADPLAPRHARAAAAGATTPRCPAAALDRAE